MKKYIHTLILVTTVTFSSFAQSFSVEGPRTIFELAANKGTNKYTFFNFDSGKEVATADSNSTKWDIAFSKTTVIINGGTSGPGSVSAQILSSTSFASLTEAPVAGYVSDGASKAVASTWYTYNGPPTHTITMNADKIIALKLADGRYVKIQMLNYYKGAPTTIPTTGGVYTGVGAYISFRYLITEAGSKDLSKLTTTVKNLYANGSHYQFFNLASGDTTIVADSSSSKWNIAFKATIVLTNSGIGGPGKDSAQISTVDFSAVTAAPLLGWKSDETASGKAIASWYNYDSQTHIISVAPDKTYILKLENGRYVKLRFDSYYKDANSSGASRYYSFTYYFQPTGSTDITATDALPIATGILGSSAKTVTIYPNPLSASESKLAIESNLVSGSVKIVDLLGNQVYTSTITDTTTQLTNVNLAKGFYLVVVESNGTLFQQKLIVE